MTNHILHQLRLLLTPRRQLYRLQHPLRDPRLEHDLGQLVVQRGDLRVRFPKDGVARGEGVAEGADAEGDAEVEGAARREL